MDESSYKEEKVTYLTSEVDTWKKKFTALNKEFHETQEKLMLTQAELDSQLHKGSTTMRVQTYINSSDWNHHYKEESDDEWSSHNEVIWIYFDPYLT